MINPLPRSSVLPAFLLSSLFCLIAPFVARAESTPAPRELIPFDTGWRFYLGDEARAAQPDFDDTAWRTLDLPHDWSIEGPLNPPPAGDGNNGFFRHGIGWYRKSFPFPADSGKKVVVEFDGVYMNSDTWINGHFLGRRPYGFIGFRYDLTEFLKTDGTPNVLAVRVDDSAEPSTRWYAGSGIYRHVRLLTTGYTHFRLDGGVRIATPEIDADQAVVEASYLIDANFFSDEERLAWVKDPWKVKPVKRALILRSSVLDADGSVVASAESKLDLESMQGGQPAKQLIRVPKPRLWSDRTPALYRLRSTLELAGNKLDETTTTFGIRQLVFDPDRGLFVNGQPTKLKGVCLHQDGGSFGNAVPIGVWALRLARLREMGCNAVRTSHHPFAPEFYDLCDQMGFYVFDEAFDEWTRDWLYNFTENSRGKAMFGYHLYFTPWHDTDLRAMLRRDRNHPSVILYSIGNEIPDQFNRDGYKLAKELVATCHEEDPTRLVTSACDQSFVASRNGFMDVLDLNGYNYIDRIYKELTYAPDRERFPHRLMLGTETSTEVHNWLGVRNNDYVIGEFIWTGLDYLGESKTLPRRGNGSGFLDLAAGKKPGFFQRAAYWSEAPVLNLAVAPGANHGNFLPRRGGNALGSWNWTAGAEVTVHAATNCEEVELFLNDKSLGRHAVAPDDYATTWTLSYAPGTLSAVGYRAGRQVAAQKLPTTGAATRLQITPVSVPHAGDLAFYEITVVDAAGLNVLGATPAVTVRIEGGGQRLVGLDTGDLEYGGLFKTDTRNAYQGRLLVTVQGTTPMSETHVTATAPGFPVAELTGSTREMK